jgi:hypothetical protein
LALENLTTKELDERIKDDRADYVDAIPEKDKAGAVKAYRDYAKGIQLCTLKAAVVDYLEGSLTHLFSDNVMHQVIAEAADRLQLLGFDVEDDAVKTFLQDEIFVKNHLDDLSGECHYAALRDSDFALMPEWNEEEKRIVIQKEDWWNGDYGVFVAYEQQQPIYAVKEWTERVDENKSRKRRNVYFDDRIERFASEGGGQWERFSLEGEGGNVVRWEKVDGSPLHIPIIHFANGGRGPGNYGVSELGGGVLGNQDALNDLRYDIATAARMTAFQMIWGSGYKAAVDILGHPIAPTFGPGGLMLSSDPAARFGTIPAGDLSQLENAYKLVLRAICRMTRTPLHAIVGDWPSGEALLRAELPAVNKARRQVAKFTSAWATLAHRCTEIFNTFGGGTLNEDTMITPKFAPVSQLGELQSAMADREFWTAANQAVTATYPLPMYLEDHDWPQDRLERLKEELEKQKAEAEAQEAASVNRIVERADRASSNGRERVGA